jgi:hypothetical protein
MERRYCFSFLLFFYCVLVAFSSSASFWTISWFDIIGSGNPASESGRGHPKLPIIDFLVTFDEISTVELSEIGSDSPPPGLQVHVALKSVPLIFPNTV